MALSEEEKSRQRTWRKQHRERLRQRDRNRYHTDPAAYLDAQRYRKLRAVYERLLEGIDIGAAIERLKLP